MTLAELMQHSQAKIDALNRQEQELPISVSKLQKQVKSLAAALEAIYSVLTDEQKAAIKAKSLGKNQ